ncbi:ATP-binding protein [Vibrio hippocampi]|uniref:histidine kinase n=1 Tax=Vibrio hippocampi TaxID=654686 RepID=A0ABM8ZHZ9_9VIBR|nr:ATP-binding protein [Vibrio hippocampi]CAH0526128.1 Adaptive-response sensory-kinase SasA [Vibrio hippocampi]
MQNTVQALIQRYFAAEQRQITLQPDSVLFRQSGHNDRLYYVLDGELAGYYEQDSADNLVKVFSAQQGAFIGVHSFFSGTWQASSTVITKTQVKLAWIDRHTAAESPDVNGPLSAQFMPVMVNELSRRQRRATQEAIAKEKALQTLHTAEQMSTLGQLAAGIAHELNNAIGVVSSKSDRLQHALIQLLEEVHSDASQFFDVGLLQGQVISSTEARNQAKRLQKKHKLDVMVAKKLAKAVNDEALTEAWLNNPEQAVRFWELGRDLHDLRLAAKHTVGIVKSVKQLGRTDTEQDALFDINDSIHKAMALLQSDLRRVSVRIRPANLPLIRGVSTEYVQVWSNILKNACDALARTEDPHIDIQTKLSNQKIQVIIANNGPEIDEATRRKIFQPNFTTKKGGLSFGLGLGLSIVKRIISENGGSIAVKSDANSTIFRIKLPVGEGYGKA